VRYDISFVTTISQEQHYLYNTTHRRSLAETTRFRLKTIFSDRVTARGFAGQAAQVLVRCVTLNRLTALGMPESYAV